MHDIVCEGRVGYSDEENSAQFRGLIVPSPNQTPPCDHAPKLVQIVQVNQTDLLFHIVHTGRIGVLF